MIGIIVFREEKRAEWQIYGTVLRGVSIACPRGWVSIVSIVSPWFVGVASSVFVPSSLLEPSETNRLIQIVNCESRSIVFLGERDG